VNSRKLLALGLFLGLIIGLVYAWGLNPVAYYDTYPPLMRESYRADWVKMTAFAYGYEGELRWARVRLQDLPEDEIHRYLAESLDDAVATGRSLTALQRMAELAASYGVESPAVEIYGSPQSGLVLPTATLRPFSSPTQGALTAVPTSTPSPVASPQFISIPITPTPFAAPYLVVEKIQSCLPEPRIAISLTQAVTVTTRGREQLEMQAIPGIEVWLLWEEGADRAVTGLRPAAGLGYADFAVAPGAYNFYVGAPTGVPLASLRIEPCTSSEEASWSSWTLYVRANGQ